MLLTPKTNCLASYPFRASTSSGLIRTIGYPTNAKMFLHSFSYLIFTDFFTWEPKIAVKNFFQHSVNHMVPFLLSKLTKNFVGIVSHFYEFRFRQDAEFTSFISVNIL